MKSISVLSIFFIIMMISCDLPKYYEYVEIVNEVSVFDGSKSKMEEAPEKIRAKNNSIAYTEAFEKFCISQHVYDIIKAKNPSATIDIPIDFKLILDNLDIKLKIKSSRAGYLTGN